MELRTPLLVVGASTGGVAAALGAARNGVACILTEPTDWVGGQLTSQGVPPDENQWIEGKDGVQGATRSYLEYRERVREWYREHRPLTAEARNNPRLNPGGGWVSHLCHEPRIGEEVLRGMLAPYAEKGLVTILLEHEPVGVEVMGDVVKAVRFLDKRSGREVVISAAYFLDATEMGDLLPMGGIEYAVGAEHRSEHGEEHGREDRADRMDQQAISWCFALEHRPWEDYTIEKPVGYEFWRGFVPALDRAWPGRLFSWTVVGGDEHKPRTFPWIPWPDKPVGEELEMWRYRRIVDGGIYTEPFADVALINMVQMDYFLKPTLDVSKEELATAFAEAKEQSLAFLYWMQTEAPRHDSDRLGYPGLKLRGEELGTEDGFAKFPYIREARRLRAVVTVTENHVNPPAAAAWEDSVGVGHYRLDLHPSTGGRNSIYVPTAPFRIPLGALIPVRVRNVLAAGKNLGVTHVTNGCYRLHPTEWNVGEAAGVCAAFCLKRGVVPREVWEKRELLREYQGVLKRDGVALGWPWEKGEGLAGV